MKTSDRFDPFVPLRWLALKLITAYQLVLSPVVGGQCRFTPSCSTYAQQAIQQHGLLKGGYLSLRRLIKCHPFHPGGCDPVPGIHNCKPEKN